MKCNVMDHTWVTEDDAPQTGGKDFWIELLLLKMYLSP